MTAASGPPVALEDPEAFVPRAYPLLDSFHAGAHARDPAGALRLQLSESSSGPCPGARDVLAQEQRRLHRYPDSGAGSLSAAIADLHELGPENVVVGNGIDELLLFTALAFLSRDRPGIVSAQTYLGHRSAVAIVRAPLLEIPLHRDQVDVEQTCAQMQRSPGVAFVCNPHNPTGSVLSKDALDALVESARRSGSLLVMDEAYMEYAEPDHGWSAVRYVQQGEPVVVLRTFSKIHGLAGLRCGYALAAQGLSEHLRKVKHVTVFNVNRLALAAAEESIRDRVFVAGVRQETVLARQRFLTQIATLPWIRATPSVANFVLCSLPWEADAVSTALERRGVLVRSCRVFGYPRHLRISMGTKDEMKYAVAALGDAARHFSTTTVSLSS